MAEAKRDGNYVTTLLAVSNVDGITPVVLYADPTTHRLLVSASAGSLNDLTDVVITAAAQGDLFYYNGTDWVNLPAGNSGEFLKTQGVGANPVWAVPTASITGADTRVLFFDGANSPAGDAGFTYNKTTDSATLAGAITVGTGVLIGTNDAGALGASGTAFSDLFLASGAVINFAAANVTITHSSGVLTLGASMDFRLTTAGTNAASVVLVGGTQTLTNKTLTSPIINTGTVGTSLNPTSDDGATLGDTTHNFSDLFLATGAVINYANSNVVITHTSGILTMGTGDFRVTNAGTNTASVVTVGGTQTLTAKTLTSPIIGTSPTAAGATWTDLGTVTTADINGGTIDGATIGGSSPGNITGLVITANTSFMPDANDGAVLGAAATAFSDLFLASGALIGFANGDAVITHSSGVIGVTTGDLRVTTAGSNSASVVTVGGSQTLTSKTISSAILSGQQIFSENARIALDASLSADGTYTGITITGTAGTTLAFGDLIYLAVADSRWELADADAATTADRMLGMCVLAAANDGDATEILLIGNIRADAAFPALTVGAAVYVGETAGDIQVAIPTGADNVIRRVGYALTADSLYFNPSMDSQITVA